MLLNMHFHLNEKDKTTTMHISIKDITNINLIRGLMFFIGMFLNFIKIEFTLVVKVNISKDIISI